MSGHGREFDALMTLRGEAYALQRDRLLGDTGGLALRLPGWLVDPEWRVRVHAEVLRGWSEHAALYRQVLAELDTINPDFERRTVLGFARVFSVYADNARIDYKEAILPLCWEVLLHFGDAWPAWKVRTFLTMIGAVPRAESVEVVLVYMQEVAPIDQIEAAAVTLRDLRGVGSIAAVTARVASIEAHVARHGADARSTALLTALRRLLQDAAEGF